MPSAQHNTAFIPKVILLTFLVGVLIASAGAAAHIAYPELFAQKSMGWRGRTALMNGNMIAREEGMMGGYATAPSAAPMPMEPMMDGYADKSLNEYSLTAGDTAAVTEPRIIKNASLSIRVDDVREAATKLEGIATAQRGYIQSSSIDEDPDGGKSGYVTLRVPVETFEATLVAVRAAGLAVINESISAQDITEQYTDLEARLRSAKAQEEQYLAILKVAKDVEDILAVQNYLSQVRSQIESLEGQIKYLGNQTGYATISVILQEDASVELPTEKFDLMRDIRAALRSVVFLFQGLLTFTVWFVIIGAAAAIPLSIIAAIIWVIVRRVMR